MSQAVPAIAWLEEEGSLIRIRLARPKANIVDSAMMRALELHFAEHTVNGDAKAVILDAEGPNFSFGASVEEHMPGKCGDMLADFHRLVKTILACPVPVIAAIKGQCLGGGLELALAANFIFAAKDTMLGQPEIKLGVFAPAASCLLPERIGRARAEELLFSGNSVDAAEALDLGIVNRVTDDPTGAAIDWFKNSLATLSASSVRFSVRASRRGAADRIGVALDYVQRLYLDELMSTRDAVEGLEAFVGKRPAKWENH
jgi:cyclohexa-1,5-dienecarbonyl-CoA hydratase